MDALPEPNALIRKLSAAVDLQQEDTELLHVLCRDAALAEGGRDLIGEGDDPRCVHLVLEGLAFRYKMLPDGSRSIVALLIPGDFCDLHVPILGAMDHSIATAEESVVACIPHASIEAILANAPGVTRAFWWSTLVDEAILREWLVNLGRRSAARRMAHVFCELHARLEQVGRVHEGSFHLPLSQAHLSDILGTSSVHTNRMLQEIRSMGLLTFARGKVTVPDPRRLAEFAEFDPTYLHLGGA